MTVAPRRPESVEERWRRLAGRSRRQAGAGRDARERFYRSRKAMLGLVLLVMVAFMTVLAPVLSRHAPDAVNMAAAEEPPGPDHWLGTDELGRDVWARLLYGGRVSLTVGFGGMAICVAVGVVLGALAGYYGGWVDALIMRVTDVVMLVPFFPLALTLAAVLGPGLYTTMVVLGLLGWTGICRLVRGEVLALSRREFVAAARAGGVSDLGIIFRHILPNAMGTVAVAATLGMASAVLSEAGLSFLGFGVQPPTPSWGNMLAAALSLKALLLQPWRWVPPAVMIGLVVLAVNLLGDGLREGMDPRLRE